MTATLSQGGFNRGNSIFSVTNQIKALYDLFGQNETVLHVLMLLPFDCWHKKVMNVSTVTAETV